MEDERKYTLQSTFYRTSDVNDVELSVSPSGLTRKVLRAELVDNAAHPENSVKICTVHQKRRLKTDAWEDVKGATLVQTSFDSPSKFPLDSAETRVLFDALCDLYKISKDGIHHGKEVVHIANPDEWVKADASRAKMISALVQGDHGSEIWEMMLQLQPDLATQLSTALAHKKRKKCLDEFEAALTQDNKEEYWRNLLRQNAWVFGGANVAIVDESRLDINHIADIPFEVAGGFMDIVELKKPNFPFWTMSRTGAPWRYRTKFLTPHPELNGAIAQMRHYILQAEKKVADTDFHRNHGVVPLKPRGLVVHGRSNDWKEDEWEAYRLLNDGLQGVQVLTFDHVLEQARRMIAIA